MIQKHFFYFIFIYFFQKMLIVQRFWKRFFVSEVELFLYHPIDTNTDTN